MGSLACVGSKTIHEHDDVDWLYMDIVSHLSVEHERRTSCAMNGAHSRPCDNINSHSLRNHWLARDIKSLRPSFHVNTI